MLDICFGQVSDESAMRTINPVADLGDLASRGLDITGLPAVVNYDLPRSPTDYLHRIGRTGRARETGVAVSFVTAEAHAHFALIEKTHKHYIPRERIAGFEPTQAPVAPPSTGGVKGARPSKKDKLRAKGLLPGT